MFRKNKNCQLVIEKQDLNLLWLSHSIVNIVTNIPIWQVVLAGETASFLGGEEGRGGGMELAGEIQISI